MNNNSAFKAYTKGKQGNKRLDKQARKAASELRRYRKNKHNVWQVVA